MKQSNITVKRIPKHIGRLLAAMGLGLMTVMIIIVMWIIGAMDDLTQEYTVNLVKISLRDQMTQVIEHTRDTARWDTGDRWVLASNGAAIYGDIGGSPRSGPVDHSYIFDKQNRVLHTVESAPASPADQQAALDLARNLVDLVRLDLTTPEAEVNGFSRIQDTLVFAAASRLTPQNSASFAPQDLPILVTFMVFDADILASLSRGLMVSNTDVSFESTQAFSEVRLPLIAGTGAAYLGWTPPDYRQEVLHRSIGVTFIFLALVLIGHLYVAHTVTRLAGAFLKESEDARTDSLTGLLNRAGFDELMEGDAVQSALQKAELGLILFDMDKFKPINDTFGHHAGDFALQTIAERMATAIRPSDFAARLGGDEFAVVMIDPDPQRVIDKTINRLGKANLTPIKVDGHLIKLSASMGSALAGDVADVRQLMMAADASMYEAKTARDFRDDRERKEPKGRVA